MMGGISVFDLNESAERLLDYSLSIVSLIEGLYIRVEFDIVVTLLF